MTLLARLVDTSQRVSATAARLAKVRELAACLRELEPSEIVIGVLYLSGETPQGRFGIGYAALRDASAEVSAREATLSIGEVDRRLDAIAGIRGSGAAARRLADLRELLSLATSAEQEFLIRLLVGELRQGALAGVMIDAIAAAADLPVAHVRRAAMYSKSIGAVARAALLDGTRAWPGFSSRFFLPSRPCWRRPQPILREALQQLGGEAVFEWKMDGARIQVHKAGDTVRIYTRSLNDVTAAVPEISEAAQRLPVRDMILDGEAIAFTQSGRPHPFQITMRRFGRKLDVETLRAELPIQAFFFDCLRLER